MSNTHPKGFIFEPTQEGEWQLGSGLATERFGAATINPSGQWGKWVPKAEKQRRKLETMACTVYHSLNAWETLANFYGYKDFPQNCSERYSAVLAEVTPEGNPPHKSCEAVRKFGVVNETALPFTDDIYDWAQYYSPNPMLEEYVKLGQTILRKYSLGHEYVFNGGVGLKSKADLLKEALTRGTVCVSVYAWKQKNGLYYKDENDGDTHWTHLIGYEDGKYWLVRDSYEPFDKKLAWDTNFQTAKLYFMKPNYDGIIPTERETLIGLITSIINALRKKLGSWIGFAQK